MSILQSSKVLLVCIILKMSIHVYQFWVPYILQSVLIYANYLTFFPCHRDHDWQFRILHITIIIPIYVLLHFDRSFSYLLRLDFRDVTDCELLCQLRFLWLMNQLLICFSCNPVSSTSFALSSSCNELHFQ